MALWPSPSAGGQAALKPQDSARGLLAPRLPFPKSQPMHNSPTSQSAVTPGSLSLEPPKLKPVRSAVGTGQGAALPLAGPGRSTPQAPSPFLLLETAVPIAPPLPRRLLLSTAKASRIRQPFGSSTPPARAAVWASEGHKRPCRGPGSAPPNSSPVSELPLGLSPVHAGRGGESISWQRQPRPRREAGKGAAALPGLPR